MPTDDQTFAEEDWGDEVDQQPPDMCPACNGNRLGYYLLGMPPPPDDELLGQMRRDEVRVVGCVFLEDQPFWFCRDCDADVLGDGNLTPSASR